MLGRPGMGLKLNTFYRRKHERDAGHLDIRKGPPETPASQLNV